MISTDTPANSPTHSLTSSVARASFTAGPAAFLGGWLLMRPIGGDLMPGPWWTAAHAVWLLGFLLFGVMVLELRRMAAPTTRGQKAAVWAVTGVALFSVLANVAQLVIDLVAGFTSADGEAMRAVFDQVQGYPGVELVVYSVGAQLFFVALLVLAGIMAVLRRVTSLSAVVVAAGLVVLAVAMLGVGRDSALVAVGMAVLWLGALLLGRGPGTPALSV
ncbi:hypothetical protein [Nonomuraea aurantiaca]|uniref:hypothetical protein n=1 Tax=Nonomuraea aurantiaca TaxID=2878562 RepID=UPI001CD97B67|nr:hypothetical protein [Nonomuraea aurantiaca]MCA2226506.1 hypothetical protein [Nonomuraea aurantiaca]